MSRPFRRRRIFDIFDEIDQMMEEMMREMMRELERGTGERRFKRGPYFYGMKITIGPDGVPRVERFGNFDVREGRPLIREEIEPLVEVMERGDEVVVLADVPGVSKENIHVEVKEREVLIKADAEERKYYRRVDLPVEVDPKSAKAAYRNGVLEIKMKKKEGEGGHKVSVE
ncbi:MAG: Hsp20/alpha crystallin family protein [Acidilobaceae archaeon]|nr:Hsp20/alpha crystallin family protein [Acidilobaceae archaeon]MCX8165117.1 Hsp20/alpha crystallin family protein [Acidilobaceae archaeon]MDW7974367.1 archaeal heat shock protein Hsp20 [Sulfolobales archaeon]